MSQGVCLSARPHRAGHAAAGLGPPPSLPLPPSGPPLPAAVGAGPHPCCPTGPSLLLFSFCLSFKPALRHCSVELGAEMCPQKGPDRPVLFHGTWTSRDSCGAREENISSLGYGALPQSEALHPSRLSPSRQCGRPQHTSTHHISQVFRERTAATLTRLVTTSPSSNVCF